MCQVIHTYDLGLPQSWQCLLWVKTLHVPWAEVYMWTDTWKCMLKIAIRVKSGCHRCSRNSTWVHQCYMSERCTCPYQLCNSLRECTCGNTSWMITCNAPVDDLNQPRLSSPRGRGFLSWLALLHGMYYMSTWMLIVLSVIICDEIMSYLSILAVGGRNRGRPCWRCTCWVLRCGACHEVNTMASRGHYYACVYELLELVT